MDTMPNHSSITKVVSNDDLLVEILSRLPVRLLLCFKSVSKHWYSLISLPNFKLLRNRKPDPPSGLFAPIQKPHSPLKCEFISFDIKNPIKPPLITQPDPDIDDFDIEHSCNGLMLFSGKSIKFFKNHTYFVTYMHYIYNPTTNRFSALPVPDIYSKSVHRYGMCLAFDPSKSPHYKIIYVSGIEKDDDVDMIYQIEIYSSETRSFKVSCIFRLDECLDMSFKGGVYWNNAIHWVHCNGVIVYFNMEQEVMHQIRPPVGSSSNLKCCYSIFESFGCFLLVEAHRHSDLKLIIHEMKRDYSGWFVKYQVDLEQLGLSFPEIVINAYSLDTYEFYVLSIVLGEKEDDESFLVLGIPGKVVRFNLVSKTSYKIHDFTSSRLISDCAEANDMLCQWPCVFPFMESLYSF